MLRGAFGDHVDRALEALPRVGVAEVYIDESSQTKHRYLILGGLIVRMPVSAALMEAFRTARLPELPEGEAKWTKVSKTKLGAYKRLVDVLFENRDKVHFHSVVVDTTLQNHKRFNEGSREIGFNKEIFQLAMKFQRLYPNLLFHLYPDFRNTEQTPDELRLILNRKCQKNGDPRDWPFRRAQFRNSKEVHALQVVDVLSGALGFHINGHASVENASPAKLELSAYIFQKAGIVDVMRDTAIEGSFTIWHRKLQK